MLLLLQWPRELRVFKVGKQSQLCFRFHIKVYVMKEVEMFVYYNRFLLLHGHENTMCVIIVELFFDIIQ
jgi:hypothetical protein